MTKYEWLESLCKDHEGKAPKVPFSAQETRGTYVLFATNLHSIVRVPCSEEDMVRYKVNDPYLSGFFDVVKEIYESTQFKGKLDALLLKDMAENVEEYIKLDGAFFDPKIVAKAMAGWADMETVWARALKSPLLDSKKNKVPLDVKTTSLHPLVLHGRHAMVVIAPARLDEEDGYEVFPETGITYTKA